MYLATGRNGTEKRILSTHFSFFSGRENQILPRSQNLLPQNFHSFFSISALAAVVALLNLFGNIWTPNIKSGLLVPRVPFSTLEHIRSEVFFPPLTTKGIHDFNQSDQRLKTFRFSLISRERLAYTNLWKKSFGWSEIRSPALCYRFKFQLCFRAFIKKKQDKALEKKLKKNGACR